MKHTKVLAYTNRIRKLLGKKPIKKLPKGERSGPFNFPIACGINDVKVDYSSMRVVKEKYSEFPIPPHVLSFIGEFDAGYYPELVWK